MTEILKAYFASNFQTTTTEIEQVVSAFKEKSVKKNETLISKGDICRYAFFVCKGSVRAYFIDDDGQEATRYIALENQFITTVHSFISQTPTNEFIQATEKAELLQISYADFKKLVEETALTKDLYNKQLEIAYITNHWRVESFLKMSAKQRYDFLLQTNPAIIQRLSNKIVASYLGITQESLSRIKAQK
ncbi:MAG: Crp/Fnr family transcriptional regulator [Flavobacteriales bacterium]|jgi:CRP-like cAMP-binding protein